MTVALAVRRIPPTLLIEVRAACKALNLRTEEWNGGIPRTPPLVVITALEPGERRLPEDLCGLLEASPGVRAFVCANEPLVKPRIALGSGRVVLLAPPIDRVRLIALLRAASGEEAGGPAPNAAARRFEALRRRYWVAWSRGESGSSVGLDERDGLLVALCPPAAMSKIVNVMNENVSDVVRSKRLVETVGIDVGIVHLIEDAAEWLIYWPRRDCPLWICSQQRLPVQWDAATAFAASGPMLMRLSAFPGDQIVGGWSPPTTAAANAELFAPLRGVMLEGGSETITALSSLTERVGSMAGMVVELR